MLNNVTVGSYYSAKSNVHNMNPLSKIICLFIFVIAILITCDFLSILFLVMVTTFVIISTRIPLNIYYMVLENLKEVLLLIFLLFSLLCFSFLAGLMILIKLVLIVLYLSILTLTTPTTEIIYGLEKFLYPLQRFRVKSNIVALNIGLGLRFIPTFIDSWNMVLQLQISRGLDYRRNILVYFKSIKDRLKSSIDIALKKFAKIKEFMIIRLFSIDSERCNFRMNKWSFYDSLLLTVHIVLLLFIILKGVII